MEIYLKYTVKYYVLCIFVFMITAFLLSSVEIYVLLALLAAAVLGLLYECFNENNPYDNEQIKADFEMLYRRMNGMPLREMDRIVYPVCRLCRDHERSGFVEGVKVGIRLYSEF